MQTTLLEEKFFKLLDKDPISQGDAERLKVLADLMKYYHENNINTKLNQEKFEFKKKAINDAVKIISMFLEQISKGEITKAKIENKIYNTSLKEHEINQIENNLRQKPLETMVKLLWGSLDEDQAIKCPDVLSRIFLAQTEKEMKDYLNILTRGDFIEISKFEQVLDKEQAKILAHIIGFEV